MAQQTTGIKALLSHARAYDFVQNLLGARASRQEIATRYIRAQPGQRVLDVGCGTGEMIEHLPDGIRYFGFDLSPDYIESARKRFGDRGRFECMDVAGSAAFGVDDADRVIAIGLLHHLDDAECITLMRTLEGLLRPGTGRIVTVDPTFVEGQSPVAAFMARRDRGRNVRSPQGYASLARGIFGTSAMHVRHDLLRIPYSHCILELTRNR